MFDVNRYTTVYPEAQYACGAQATLDTMRAQGLKLNVKKYWNVDTNPYQGLNVQATTAAGQKFELQFHSGTSLSVKEGEMHSVYELQRVEPDATRWDEYAKQVFAVSAKIPVPPGISSVK